MSKRMKIVAVVIACLLVATGAAIKLWADTGTTTPKNQNEVKSTEEKVQSQVKLALPGATPIDALKEDYASPTSLWTVVSKDFPLADLHYRPTDLVVPAVTPNTSKTADEQSLSARVKTPVEELFAAAKANGHDLMVGSGFRSYELQQYYFGNYSAAYGEAAAVKFSARPGQSEHQTGFALDIAYANRDCYLSVCFGEKPAGQWLVAHAWEYGFVLRYPADKTEVTKYQYEPWHFRYVGKELAQALHTSGLTLDEAKPHLDKALSELKTRGEI